jgi:hypothetical protein
VGAAEPAARRAPLASTLIETTIPLDSTVTCVNLDKSTRLAVCIFLPPLRLLVWPRACLVVFSGEPGLHITARSCWTRLSACKRLLIG